MKKKHLLRGKCWKKKANTSWGVTYISENGNSPGYVIYDDYNQKNVALVIGYGKTMSEETEYIAHLIEHLPQLIRLVSDAIGDKGFPLELDLDQLDRIRAIINQEKK